MLSCYHPNNFTLFNLFFPRSNGNNINPIVPNSFHNRFNTNHIIIHMGSHQIITVIEQLRVRIRIGGCKIDSISIMEIILERQRIIIFTKIILPPNFILSIIDFLAIPTPTNIMTVILFLGECQWFYAIGEHWLFFGEINDVEFYSVVFFCVYGTEEEPLVVSFCVYVVVEEEVVGFDLLVLVAVCVEEVAGLEMWLESYGAWVLPVSILLFIFLSILLKTLHSLLNPELLPKININIINNHHIIRKIILLNLQPKSRINWLPIPIHRPQSQFLLSNLSLVLL